MISNETNAMQKRPSSEAQSLSWSRIQLHFVEPGGLLPGSQKSATGPYPEPVQTSPHSHIRFL